MVKSISYLTNSTLTNIIPDVAPTAIFLLILVISPLHYSELFWLTVAPTLPFSPYLTILPLPMFFQILQNIFVFVFILEFSPASHLLKSYSSWKFQLKCVFSLNLYQCTQLKSILYMAMLSKPFVFTLLQHFNSFLSYSCLQHTHTLSLPLYCEVFEILSCLSLFSLTPYSLHLSTSLPHGHNSINICWIKLLYIIL